MRIVLAGASGVIGSALKQELREHGHQVDVLVRQPTTEPGADSWDPAAGRVDPDFLAGADAVVCLSGVNVGRRWTESYKRAIVSSRVDSVGTLAESLAKYGGPRVLVAASAVGYYGDTGDEVVREDHASGTSFLASVCRQWEAAADPARNAGVRVAHLRTGLVLSPEGGLLQPLVLLGKVGLLGRTGSGKQYMPWISLADEVAAIRFVVEHEVSGPVNLTGPKPARNAEFVKTLGQVLHRPAVFPAPGFGVKLVLGEFAGEVLTGQNAIPAALTEAGFSFLHGELEPALRWALKK